MKKSGMRKGGWWWISACFMLLILGFTFVVRREEMTGGSCARQSQSQNESYSCRLIAPANLPTGYLVIVGIGGVFVAVSTLSAIRRQTRSIHHQAIQVRQQTHILNKSAEATEIAAESAKASADALIASERAWLIAELVPTAIKHGHRWYVPDGNKTGELSDADLSDGNQFKYQLKVTNMGRTPAFVTNYSISRSNGSDEGQLIDFELPHRSLGAGGQWYLYALDVDTEVRNYSDDSAIVFFGNITYQHVFSNKTTIQEHFAYAFKRETGRLERMPVPENRRASEG
ncbi:MAG TPA: hypothetical protein VNV41_13905 [Candidatus Acidoferrales bacterium]|nr:hypothetical protein [Candidatus Acidoferrales bacterium]